MNRLFILALVLLFAVSFCTCGKSKCKRPEIPKNVKIKYKKLGAGNSIRVGSKIIFKCNKGFLLFGPKRIKCRSNGRWTANVPVCADQKIKCPMPEPIENGTVTTASSRRVLSNANYRCHKDYELIGPKRRKCLPSAKWSSPIPKCIKKKCQRPRLLSRFKNGKISIEEPNFEIWSSIIFDCHDGYYLAGGDQMTCAQNKIWQPRTVPRCHRIDCGNPGTPRNGRRYGSNFTLGATVKFYCNYGYQLVGAKERVCQSNFQWSGEPVVCDNKKYDCVDPGIPVNGRRIGNRFNIGDTVKYYCLSGYTFSGSAERRCKLLSRNVTNSTVILNTIWTGVPPLCEDDKKISIPSVNETATMFESNFIDKLAPVTCSSNNDGKCNYPRYRGRSITMNHPDGLDLVFVIDSSTSIGEKNFRLGLQFACFLIRQLGVDYKVGGTRVAAITFATRAYLNYNLGDRNVNKINKACRETEAIPYSGGGTGTAYGLQLVLKRVKPLFREGSNRAVMLIADGKSNFGVGFLEKTARELRDKHNVEIFAIGVGRKVGKTELKLIASKGEGHIFHLKSYDDFSRMAEKMIIKDYSKCGKGGIRSRGRILGGNAADSTNGTQWPWQVAIYRNLNFICGGSLIKNNVVLTAAHCLLNKERNSLITTPNSYRVIAGKLNISIPKTNKKKDETEQWLFQNGKTVKEIFRHQQYRPPSFQHDIALFQLDEPVEWSSKIRPVCLPTPGQYVKPEIYGYVTGWGFNVTNPTKYTRPSKRLNYVSLRIRNNHTCALQDKRKEMMFCAGEADGRKDSCGGDSGGPFVVRFADNVKETEFSYKVVGIVSHGPVCGTEEEYGFYTRVGNYVDWIKKTMSNMK